MKCTFRLINLSHPKDAVRRWLHGPLQPVGRSKGRLGPTAIGGRESSTILPICSFFVMMVIMFFFRYVYVTFMLIPMHMQMLMHQLAVQMSMLVHQIGG